MHYEYSPQVLDKLRYKFRTRLLFYLSVFKEDDENEDGTIIITIVVFKEEEVVSESFASHTGCKSFFNFFKNN